MNENINWDRFKELKEHTHNSQMALYALAAEELGAEYEMVIRALLIEFRKDNMRWRIHKSLTPVNNSVAAAIASYKSTSNKFLRKKGFPMPKQTSARSAKDIIKYLDESGLQDIVIKPKRGVGGHGVTILPRSKEEIEAAYNEAREHNLSRKQPHAVVEEFIPGENYRLLVLGDKVIAAAHRIAASVTGNGTDTIEVLIKNKNKQLKKMSRPTIPVDEETHTTLEQNNMTLQSIPQKGKEVKLRFNANMTSGGSTRECLSEVHPEYKKVAIEITKAIGLELAGLDLITTDITKPTKNYGINEVNHNPGLRIHYMPDEGESFHVALNIQKYIIDNFKTNRE